MDLYDLYMHGEIVEIANDNPERIATQNEKIRKWFGEDRFPRVQPPRSRRPIAGQSKQPVDIWYADREVLGLVRRRTASESLSDSEPRPFHRPHSYSTGVEHQRDSDLQRPAPSSRHPFLYPCGFDSHQRKLKAEAAQAAQENSRIATLVVDPPAESSELDDHLKNINVDGLSPTDMSHFRNTLEVSRLSPYKQQTIQEAKIQETAIRERLKKLDIPQPKFKFLELIGKGSYGRVYKSLDEANRRIVAVKVIDADAADYNAPRIAKDDGIGSTIHEINVLYQLKASNAVNVNAFYEAFQVHSQFWIVNEYCPGGSIGTLKRATNGVVPEKYIIPIARELAAGLKSVHDAGIVHRDIKCANVMIGENGNLQIIDFGVAGLLESKQDKRNTVIGTAHWMAPEMHKNPPPEGLQYGNEVDNWAYGCTLYECATGLPPNHRMQPGRLLGNTLKRTPPRLNDQFSTELRDLVSFVLEPIPAERPSMSAVCSHPVLAGSEVDYPTSSLKELVEIYHRWEKTGGQRVSLFIKHGAARPEILDSQGDDDEDWNFSTTAGFDQQQAGEIHHSLPTTASHLSYSSEMDLDAMMNDTSTPTAFSRPERDLQDRNHSSDGTSLNQSLQPTPTATSGSLSTSEFDGMSTPINWFPDPNQTPSSSREAQQKDMEINNIKSRGYQWDDEPFSAVDSTLPTRDLNPSNSDNQGAKLSREEVIKEKRVKRGEQAMQSIFDENQHPYKYELKSDFKKDHRTSDLPLRSGDESLSTPREARYNVGGDASSSGTPQINLATITAKKASQSTKRDTMAWKWDDHKVADPQVNDQAMVGHAGVSMVAAPEKDFSAVRPPLKHAATAPAGDRPISETLDLDALMGDDEEEGATPSFPAFTFPSESVDPAARPASAASTASTAPTASTFPAFVFPPAPPIQYYNTGGNATMAPTSDEVAYTIRPALAPAAPISGDELPPHRRTDYDIPPVDPAALAPNASREVLLRAFNVGVATWMRELGYLLTMFEEAEEEMERAERGSRGEDGGEDGGEEDEGEVGEVEDEGEDE